MINSIIVENIKFALYNKGLTQANLAEYLNVSEPTISQWFSGKRPVPKARIPEILNYLGISLGEIDTIHFEPAHSNIPMVRIVVTIDYNVPPLFYKGDEVLVQTGVIPREGDIWVAIYFNRIIAGIISIQDGFPVLQDFCHRDYIDSPHLELVGKAISLQRNLELFKHRNRL